MLHRLALRCGLQNYESKQTKSNIKETFKTSYIHLYWKKNNPRMQTQYGLSGPNLDNIHSTSFWHQLTAGFTSLDMLFCFAQKECVMQTEIKCVTISGWNFPQKNRHFYHEHFSTAYQTFLNVKYFQ